VRNFLYIIIFVLVYLNVSFALPSESGGTRYSPYFMLHEIGFSIRHTAGGTMPKTLRKWANHTGGGDLFMVFDCLGGKSTSPDGFQTGDVIISIGKTKLSSLKKMTYSEVVAALYDARENGDSVMIQRSEVNANGEVKIVKYAINIAKEAGCVTDLLETDKDYVLEKLITGRSLMLKGDWEQSRQFFVDAIDLMEESEAAGEKSKRVKAMLGAEASKYFKGDIYECAMANFYLGLINYSKGNHENALIGFRRSLLNDMESKKLEHQDDFNISHYMMALSCKALGDLSNAKAAYQKAVGSNTAEIPNSSIIIELGKPPVKSFGGVQGERDIVIKGNYPERFVDVYIDGQKIGSAMKIMDMYEQASTVGRTTKDNVQLAKGLLKFGVKLAASVVSSDLSNAVGRGWDVRGDTRTWSNLPGEIHVFQCNLAEGSHDVTLIFKDENGDELKRYEQSWYDIPMGKPNGVYLFKSQYDICNIAAPVELAKPSKVKDKVNTMWFDKNHLTNISKETELAVIKLCAAKTDASGELLSIEQEVVGKARVKLIKGKNAEVEVLNKNKPLTKEMYLKKL
jgi:tetratricopeptide (TPR) repeat protein